MVVGGRQAEPIARAQRLLLVAGARVANTGLRWKDDSRTSVGDQWGHAPARIEPVTGRLELCGLEGATGLTLYPLDPRGQPSAEGRPFLTEGDIWKITLDGKDATLWYLIKAAR